jgi:hypothetical protein
VPRARPPDMAHLAILPPHDNDGPRLSCSHLVRHPTSFLSPLMPHASASAPPHSRQRAWEQAPPPRIRLTPAPTPTRVVAIARPRGRFTACVHHHFRCRWTSHSSSRPSPCSSAPTYYPCPRSQPRVDRCSLTRVRGESVLLLAFLCACH